MTNGQPLVVRAAKKPISTLRKGLESVNLNTKESETAEYERSDVCAVSAASVIVENVVAFEVARALVEDALHVSTAEGIPFDAALARDTRVGDVLEPAALARALDPSRFLGDPQDELEQVLAAVAELRRPATINAHDNND